MIRLSGLSGAVAPRTSFVNGRQFASQSSSSGPRVVLFGPPVPSTGSGKGTQATKLTRDFNVPRFSTGDLLRQAVAEGSPLGKKVEAVLNSGALVDAATMREVVKTALSGHTKWIMDGYPRTLEQAADFDSILASIKQDVQLALFIEIADEVLIERIENRRVHLSSGRIYHLTYNPPKIAGKDDITGEPLIHREDDKREYLEKRLAAYHASTKPLIEYYRKKGVLEIVPSPNSDVGYVKIKSIWENKFGKGQK